MRILVVGLRGFPGVQGGVETHAENLYPLLVERGCDVEVIVRSPYVQKSMTKWRGVRFFRVWAPKFKGLESLIHSVFGVFIAGIKRPDILHIHAIGPAIVTPLAKFMKLNVVVTHHGPDYDREKWRGFGRWILKRGERWGMLYSSQRIVISRVIYDIVERDYNLKSNIIPNGVVIPKKPVGTETLEKFGLKPGFYVLLVSRLVPEKRHFDLIDAFLKSRLPNWKLVIVGANEIEDAYSKKVFETSENAKNIVATGFQKGDALAQLYSNAGVFVLPSSHEGLPIAMLEALSYGVPVLASNIAANLEVGLDQETYFPLGDVESLSQLLEKRASYKIGEKDILATIDWVRKKYSWEEIAEKTLSVYNYVIDDKSKFVNEQ